MPPLTGASEGKVWGSRMMQRNWISYPVIHWYFTTSEPKNHHFSRNFFKKQRANCGLHPLIHTSVWTKVGTIYWEFSRWVHSRAYYVVNVGGNLPKCLVWSDYDFHLFLDSMDAKVVKNKKAPRKRILGALYPGAPGRIWTPDLRIRSPFRAIYRE